MNKSLLIRKKLLLLLLLSLDFINSALSDILQEVEEKVRKAKQTIEKNRIIYNKDLIKII